MIRIAFLLFAVCSGFQACAQTQPAPRATIFVASTPCSKDLKPLPGMSATTNCEFAKWHLTLNRNTSGEPSSYKLVCEYGMTLPNTTNVGEQRKTLNLEGKWTIRKGTKTNTDATVYQLETDNNQQISFLQLNGELLHLLDNEDKLMIGTPGWSFTLNKVNNKTAIKK